MVRTILKLVLVATIVVALTGCGTPGPPQPPSLNLPRPAEDLAATRKGNKVTLAWTPPRKNTDGTNVRVAKLGPARVCRGIEVFPMTQCVQAVAEIPASKVASIPTTEPPAKLEFTDTLTDQIQSQHPTGFATYAIEALNVRGRSAGVSNQVRVALAPTQSPPATVTANSGPDAILLKWTAAPFTPIAGLSYAYRVYRRQEGSPVETLIGQTAAQAVPPPADQFADRNFEWQKSYLYHVAPLTIVSSAGKIVAEVQGADSPDIKVFASDIFPPAPPSGLEAVYSGVGQKPFIDLTWVPNTESDLAGYNVYRQEAAQPPVQINRELVKTPAFRDQNVTAGKKYFYSVTAVDLRGNESGKSEETSESVP
ncbi:MAG: fibronectin type III domain-containing protein [Terriglobales bacterium]